MKKLILLSLFMFSSTAFANQMCPEMSKYAGRSFTDTKNDINTDYLIDDIRSRFDKQHEYLFIMAVQYGSGQYKRNPQISQKDVELNAEQSCEALLEHLKVTLK
jgi:hypothetical protein